MRRVLVAALLLLPLAGAAGCSPWQANRGSEAADIDPFAVGTGQPVFTPSNAVGYVNGEALDMRSRR